jgi:3-oxoacyl-[acyl-carrier-protein] synthase III
MNRVVGTGMAMPPCAVDNHLLARCTAASVPIALHEAVQAGLVRDGDLVLLASFGTGFSWGATLIRW